MSSRNDPRIFWTQARIKTLKKLWEKKSNSEIAVIMGSTRNAVAGIASRLGMTKPKPEPKPKKARIRKMSEEEKKIRLASKPPVEVIRGDSIPPLLDSVLGLTSENCAYPYGERPDVIKFCGRPRFMKSFCQHHAHLCYLPLQARSNRPMVFRKWQ